MSLKCNFLSPAYSFLTFVLFQGSHEVWQIWSFFSLEKLPGKYDFFGLLVWKNKMIFQTWSFDVHFHNILFKIDNCFTSIVLAIIVPVFDLGMLFAKVKSGKGLSDLNNFIKCDWS